MKCPKCGFVSFAGLSACEKCGRPFSSVVDSPVPLSRRFSHLASFDPSSGAGLSFSRPAHPDVRAVNALPSESSDSSRVPGHAAVGRVSREDLADRVAHFRVRRAGLHHDAEPDGTLEFDFAHGDDAIEAGAKEPEREDLPNEFGLAASGGRGDAGLLDSIPLRGSASHTDLDLGSAGETAEWTIESRRGRMPPEIVLDDAGHEADLPLEPAWRPAPLSRRLAAGILDSLALAASAAFFFAVFFATGGRLRPQPVELAVAGFVGLFFLVFYFALFGSLAFATPGQRACGLVIRNLDGGLPTLRVSLWRVLGYVVSASAFMLGFIWALVDSDGLTWHDRISGTCLIPREEAS